MRMSVCGSVPTSVATIPRLPDRANPATVPPMLVLLTANALACDPAELVRAIDAGEAAFGQNDTKAVHAANRAARKSLACTSPTPEQNARLHRLIAYEAGLQKDWERAEEAWRSSIAAHPLLPPEKALWGHPRLHLAWVRAQETPVAYTIAGSQPLAGLKAPLVPNTKPLGGSSRARSRGLRYAGVGFGVVAAGLYGAAWASNAGYTRLEDQRAPLDKRQASYRTTNTLTIASVGSLVLGGTLLTVSFVK